MGRATFSMFFAVATLAGACSSGSEANDCKTNADCAANEICISFMCRAGGTPNACTTDDQCDLGFFCDVGSGICLSMDGSRDAGPRDAGPSTTPRDAGIRDGGSSGQCTMDSECGMVPVDICVADQCVKGCGETDGIMCTGGTVCDMATGHCVPPMMGCLVDGDCSPGPPSQICVGMQCIAGCGANPALCQTGEICDTGTGHCVTAPMPCATDTECNPPSTVCEVPQCVPGCGQPGGIQCTGATPMCDAATGRCMGAMPCNLDADCTGMDEICVNMACIVRCDVPGGLVCNAPEVCNPASGRCTPGNLPLGDPCVLDGQCQSDFCLPLTVGGTAYQVCTEPCGRTGDCPLNFNCSDVVGMSFCLGENLSTPPATWDTASGGACSTTVNTCQSGWCNTGTNQCIETCQRDSHCNGFGGQCWTYEQSAMTTSYDHLCFNAGTGGADGASCTANTSCISGICNRYSAQCANHCCSDADCGAGQSCGIYDLDATTVVKVCTARSATAGTTPIGGTCTAATDCDTEVCAPLDPTDPMSPRRCSTTCCTNADCSVLPGGVCRPLNGPVMGTIVGVCI